MQHIKGDYQSGNFKPRTELINVYANKMDFLDCCGRGAGATKNKNDERMEEHQGFERLDRGDPFPKIEQEPDIRYL